MLKFITVISVSLSAIALFNCNTRPQISKASQTTITSYKLADNDTIRIYTKVFDTLNNILLYKEGYLKINDSIVYKYNYPKDTVEECEYNIYDSKTLELEACNKYRISTLKSTNSFSFYVDTFNLYDELSFKEVQKNYSRNLKVDTLASDTGRTIKYRYGVGEAIYMLLPFIDNHRGAEYAITLDSMNLFCHKKQIIREEYFFEDRKIIRNYKYSNGRLVSKLNMVYWSTDKTDSYTELFKYDYFPAR